MTHAEPDDDERKREEGRGTPRVDSSLHSALLVFMNLATSSSPLVSFFQLDSAWLKGSTWASSAPLSTAMAMPT